MKKILSLILAVVISLSLAVFSSAAEKGDVDRDGKITASDARLTLRYAVGLDAPDAEQIILADYDTDGSVSASDARLILRVSVGLSENEPPPEKDPPEEHYPSERELKFQQTLYDTAHPLLGQHKVMFDNDIMKNFQKWCCLYTIKDVFRPALEKAGYTEEEVNLLAPKRFSKDSIAKALSSTLNTNWPDWLIVDSLDLYVPSLLADYYIKTPKAADTYMLYDYYDDVIEKKVYEHSDTDREYYEPRIGDVLFISNKTKTYENGYPTVDHTAQIIEVYEDGTFLCTEGSIIENYENDGLARVRERKYRYNEEIGTYEFVNNKLVVVLFAAQPKFP